MEEWQILLLVVGGSWILACILTYIFHDDNDDGWY